MSGLNVKIEILNEFDRLIPADLGYSKIWRLNHV